ncbi:glucan 1,3-beta-glucosidase precursor [Candida tropicalis MYA-3404]|uniref:glucan 1,3-beta-glucosidase n=1 Tax=Candida tropicalis (strain ATCC MYA-3404 / T1) TaxID=294747 RepID=C5M280_CANTT|nr:glucan 1,3-beta-glucosidase precursor [Candida tropicalis MYA-3404]EER35430.1 glucan 1,3-beta-glucosidase precursor [Candida tropicalis MYA-3404]KAG4409534.1 hypothetical protein JTP64_000172 [Candida tropicalis]MCP8715991.1 glycosyl hydrolase family 17 protein [Asgard group archaeon]
MQFKYLAGLLPLFVTAVQGMGDLGFNLGVQNNDGSCKTAEDYKSDLDVIKNYAKVIKIFSVSNCDTLKILGPVAEEEGFQIQLGVWPDDPNQFNAEKEALSNYLPNISKSTVKIFLVGSEALYRKDMTADALADAINEVRDLINDTKDKNGDSYKGVPTGFVESWNVIADGTANAVISASDVVYANFFAYWQGSDISNASYVFFDDAMQALQTIQTAKGQTDIEFWVGESGWPTEGQNFGAAEPSVDNAAEYYQKAICALRAWGIPVSVFEAFDETWKPTTSDTQGVENSWGVWDSSRKLKYPISCDFS